MTQPSNFFRVLFHLGKRRGERGEAGEKQGIEFILEYFNRLKSSNYQDFGKRRKTTRTNFQAKHEKRNSIFQGKGDEKNERCNTKYGKNNTE